MIISGNTQIAKIDETFPWSWERAQPALSHRSYAIGAIVSMKLGCVIVSLGHDGPDMDDNIAKADTAGRYIVDTLNKLHGETA